MAKIFLDTNYFIDAVVRNPQIAKQMLENEVFFSTLSAHILFYAYKIKIPSKIANSISKKFNAADFTAEILEKALLGPTNDLEDNIQLHSSSGENCDFFLTNDKKLLKMRFFGKTQILQKLQLSAN